MTFVSATRLRIRASRYLPPFFWFSLLSTLQAKRAQGNLRVALLNDANKTFWTLTAWKNEAAMRAFMTAGIHRRAMPKLLEWCDEASVVHWHQDSADLPNWKQVHLRMVAEGRLSKVNHPSAAHLAGKIVAPRVTGQ